MHYFKQNLKRSIDNKDSTDLLKLSQKKLKQLTKLKNKEIRCKRILEELCSKCRNPKVYIILVYYHLN